MGKPYEGCSQRGSTQRAGVEQNFVIPEAVLHVTLPPRLHPSKSTGELREAQQTLLLFHSDSVPPISAKG